LMLTVQGHKPDIVEGLSAGANDYLTKPYDSAELRARATSLFRMRRLYDQLRREREERERLLVSAREASARAEQANQAKDDFLATISHELRTPLNAILGWVTLLRTGALATEKAAHALATIDRNARAQTQLIDDLLDVSRIITGKLRLALEPTDLAQAARAAMDAVRPAAEAKQIRLNWHVEPAEILMLGDAIRLQQVVWNLLTNAIKFTSAGGTVEGMLRLRDDGIELVVEDDGRGIEEHLVPLIFERFRQADASFSRNHGGLGLGLAIVRHIVDLHGGSVVASSAGLGKGATFVVKFPALSAQSMPDSTRRPSEPPPVAADHLSAIRVLLVDDDRDSRDAVATLLDSYGATVLTAASADEALTAMDRAIPDVLVSDIGMPDEDGLSLLRRVRARTKGARRPRAGDRAHGVRPSGGSHEGADGGLQHSRHQARRSRRARGGDREPRRSVPDPGCRRRKLRARR
jgi:signal transduction histidine kinase